MSLIGSQVSSMEEDEVAVVVVVIVDGSSDDSSIEHRVVVSTYVDVEVDADVDADVKFVFELTRSAALSSSIMSSLVVIAELLKGPGSSVTESTWMHLSELDLGLSSIRMIFVAGFDISEESASSAEASDSESGRLCIYSD